MHLWGLIHIGEGRRPGGQGQGPIHVHGGYGISVGAMACLWGLGHIGESGRLGGHGQGPGHMCGW